MKSDLITIFNQLTSSELADYKLFSSIIEDHYEKFKYLYSLIEDIDLSRVKKIYCETDNDKLIIYIEASKIKYLNDIIYYINLNKNSYDYSDYFNTDLIQDHSNLRMEITLKPGMKEEDIYANRFV